MNKRPSFRFGDLVINHTAGDRNPHKVAMAIRTNRDTVTMTNSKGQTWETYREAKLERIGSVLDPSAVEKMGPITSDWVLEVRPEFRPGRGRFEAKDRKGYTDRVELANRYDDMGAMEAAALRPEKYRAVPVSHIEEGDG